MASNKTWIFVEGFDDNSYQELNMFDGTSGLALTTGPDGRGQALDTTSVTGVTDPILARMISFTIGFRYFPTEDGYFFIGGANATNQKQMALGSFGSVISLHKAIGSNGSFADATVDTYPKPDDWFYVEITTILGNSNNGTIIVHIDGVEAFNEASGFNTDTSTNTNEMRWGNHGYYDDLYLSNGNNGTDEFYGPVYISKIKPDGAGSNTAWTGTYTDIDDGVANTASSISTTSSGAAETNTYEDIPFGVSSVHLVQWNFHGKADGRVRPMVRNGGGTEAYGDYFWLPSDWGERRVVMETDPITAAAWTGSNIDAYEFGVEAE